MALRPSFRPFEGVTGRVLDYYLVYFVSLALVLILLRIVNSPFGSVLMAIRENPFRAEAIGYRTVVYRTLASCIAAATAALAGALLALWSSQTNPDTTLSFDIMVDILLMVVIGGMGTMYGAAIGAVLLVFAQNYLQDLLAVANKALAGVPLLGNLFHPDRWLLWLGVAFILCVYFFPTGVVGKLRERRWTSGCIGLDDLEEWFHNLPMQILLLVAHLSAVLPAAVALWSMRHELSETARQSVRVAASSGIRSGNRGGAADRVAGQAVRIVGDRDRPRLRDRTRRGNVADGHQGLFARVGAHKAHLGWHAGRGTAPLAGADARFVSTELMGRQSGGYGVLGAAAAFLAAYLAGRVITLLFYNAPRTIHLDMVRGQSYR